MPQKRKNKMGEFGNKTRTKGSQARVGIPDEFRSRINEISGFQSLLGPEIVELVIEFLKRKYPWYPPCEGAIMTAAASGWCCYKGFISFVDTVTWRCPDGTTVTKEGAAIVTDQKC